MSLLVAISTAITLVSIFFLSKFLNKGHGSKNLPRGSLGLPLIGETISFLKALRKDQGPEWTKERVSKYGQIFKTSLMGTPTVVIVGQAGNKFILGADDDVLSPKQPASVAAIGGKHNLLELTGSRFKLIKGAIVSFLKPESLQNSIKQMDELVTTSLLRETKERNNTISTVAFTKRLSFDIACSILFGIHDLPTKDAFFADFVLAFKASWSVPVNFPGTTYYRGLQARARIIDRLLPIIRKRKEELSKGVVSPTSGVLASLLALRDENGEAIKEEEICDNFILLIIGSHDTTAILMCFMVWKMSRDKETYLQILKEQMDILKNRETKEQKLTWADIQKMKYTWRVAQEMLRMIPPVFGSFRKALKDTSFGGYDIPKGWQLFWVAHGTHMDEDIFENPMEFDPSRFNNVSSKPIPPYAYVPFGGGTRSCIGSEFARVEILTTIHKLVTMFQWSPVYPNEAITRRPMPYPSMGFPIKVNPIIP